jgi:site-specific recombinase XerC
MELNEKKVSAITQNRMHLTKDEVEEICQAARDTGDYRAWAAMTLGFNHGFRVSELVGGAEERDGHAAVSPLRLADIDMKHRRIGVRRLKGSIDGMHDLIDLRGNPTMSDVAALKAYLKVRIEDGSGLVFTGQKGPLQRWTLTRIFRTYCQQVSDERVGRGLPAIPQEAMHWHTLRHSIATILANSDAGIFHAKNHLGHAAISSTQIYAHPDARATAMNVKRVLASTFAA